MSRDARQFRRNFQASSKLIALGSLILGLAGCGASEHGTISLASYGNGGALKQRAAIAAGMPDGVSSVVLARALGQDARPSRSRRTPGGAR